ncbi:MAG: hypothetical protein QGG36_14040, partial [Pirellulaceae bacterium]|nr:hypothetical protein [Pirellulaceae bacterium]
RFVMGAVYVAPGSERLADISQCVVSLPRCFEWNVFHSAQMEYACLDMDGVICEDWTGFEGDEGESRRHYVHHLRNARPLFTPTSYRPLAIVTGRLERYRRETEQWLARHNVRPMRLLMSQHDSAWDRRRANDIVQQKANAYTAMPNARLFVESDRGIATGIQERSGRPVLCTADMELIAPTAK